MGLACRLGDHLFERKPVVMTSDPLVRGLNGLAENLVDLFAPYIRSRIWKKSDSHFDPNVVTGFIVPNIAGPESPTFLAVAVAFFFSEHGLGNLAVAESKGSNSTGLSHDSYFFK